MFTLNCKGRLLIIDKPIVMGILNINENSFYNGSRFTTDKEILSAAEKMLKECATILDIGAQSTKPGSERIYADEELSKAIPAIEIIHKNFPEAYISIDTYYASVAREAVAAGACIVNDISAGNIDEKLIDAIAELHVPYILMHMQGTQATMQLKPYYENVTKDVLDFFIEKIAVLKSKNIHDIIADFGFGFGKAATHNFTLLKNLSVFKMLDCPILLGLSRKQTIYKTLATDAANALNGTTVLHTIGLLNGANILRVHDVKEAVEAIKMIEAYKS